MSNESKVVAQHTPGPWELMERGAYGDFDGRSQIIMSEPLSGENPFRLAAVHVDNMDDVAGAANARLIAAAPELLEALKLYAEVYSEHWRPGMPILEPISDAAIKKATGEEA
jgi:hypothetical protein